MSIYNDVLTLQNAIDDALVPDENGNINDDALNILLDAKDYAVSDGMERLAKVRANKMSDIAGMREEYKRMAERIRVAENNLTRLESTMLNLLKLSGHDKITAGTFTIGTRKSVSVWVSPDFNNPEFMRIKTTSEPDKVAIKDALKSGEKIDGAYLTEKENLAIK